MKQAGDPEAPNTTQNEPIGQIIPLRSETALSRYPLHNIAKKARIEIKQSRKNARGKMEVTWEVRNPPGPLAYKVDTAIVNRRVDALRPNIPKLIRLGSLREICEELGITPNGENTNAIKEALRENAFTGITACLDYRGNDGTQRHFEFSGTRYIVIFTGERLPNGRRADAVYISFHEVFLDLINCAQTRPLDYEYLRDLPPAAQRLYELVSFGIFGSLNHGQSHTTMLYSVLCQSAPLTRYHAWEQAKKQLYKIHKPHLDSGYLAKVEYEKTADLEGCPDWLIRYYPGSKAKREFREFTKTKAERREESRTALTRAVSAPNPPISLDLELGRGLDRVGADAIDEDLVARLMAEDVKPKMVRRLMREYSRDRIERHLEALQFRKIDKTRAGVLVDSIVEDWSLPAEIEEEKRAQTRKTDAEKSKECPLCRHNYEIAKGQRRILNPQSGRPSWKDCSHDPEKESKYKDAD